MNSEGYFKYIPTSSDAAQWELVVTDCGWTHVPPDSPYPPGKHPDNYLFSPTTGRVLQEAQVVYITRGEGSFWSEQSGGMSIRSGTVFILFPGVRHRYGPGQATGWDEHWVGFTGGLATRLMDRFFVRDKPVIEIGHDPELLNLFMEICDMAKYETFGHRPIIAAKTMEVLARLHSSSRGVRSEKNENLVRETCCHISDFLHESIDFQQYARQHGISYSSFRRLFKEHTGLAPNQYLLELRIRKARGLLINTDMSIETVSGACGFENSNYFSRFFKSRVGMAPLVYRRQQARLQSVGKNGPM